MVFVFYFLRETQDLRLWLKRGNANAKAIYQLGGNIQN